MISTTITVAEARALIVRLKVATICDPACGSGAYLLGMLHELFTLRQILDTKDEQSSAADDYDRKVGIIRNNLYGVDLDVLAVNIAWLRVWLALIIEDERNPIDDGSDVSLPNIDAKIAQGNSLLGPGPATSQSALQDESLIDEIREKRGRYIVAHGPAKRELAELIIKAKQQLATNLGHPSAKPEEAFDWVVEFPEVLLPREPAATIGGALNLGHGELAEAPSSVGFDIILANPPYVRHELITAIKPQLRQVFGENYSGTADLYTFFYLRSIGLIKAGGMLCFISSNKWFRAAYGANLRRFIAGVMDVRSITDFGELKVFETAATFPMIFIAQKGKRDGSAPTFTQVKSLDPPYPDVAALIAQSSFALPPGALNGAEWRLVDAETAARMSRMEASGVPLGEYVKGKIYRGILTGFNEAFVIDGKKRAELIAEDPSSAEIIKPLAVGDDVRKWRIRKRDVWLIVTKIGVNMGRYPAIMRHLKQWEPQLRARQDQGQRWWELRACAYYAEFDKPKIVFPEIAMERRFCYDPSGTFTNNKAFIVPLADLFLLGVLNSSLAWEFASMACAALGDEDNSGRVMLQWINFQRTPIPHASAADRTDIEALVQQILDLKAADPAADVSAIEAEIDKRVKFLYFKQHEAPTYDEWVAKREAERGTIIEEVRQLLAVGHETVNLECKSTFAWDVKKNEQGDYLKDEVHTAICALLNAQGGDILIGVEELDGNILRVRGLAEDLRRYGGKDGLLSALEQPLGRTLYPNPIGHVDIKAVDIDGETIVRVHVTPDHTERYRFKDQIYVRRNTKSKPPLTADEAAIWWPKRQRGEV